MDLNILRNCPELQGEAGIYNSVILRDVKLVSAKIFSLTLRESHTKVVSFEPSVL